MGQSTNAALFTEMFDHILSCASASLIPSLISHGPQPNVSVSPTISNGPQPNLPASPTISNGPQPNLPASPQVSNCTQPNLPASAQILNSPQHNLPETSPVSIQQCQNSFGTPFPSTSCQNSITQPLPPVHTDPSSESTLPENELLDGLRWKTRYFMWDSIHLGNLLETIQKHSRICNEDLEMCIQPDIHACSVQLSCASKHIIL